jgi:hypothetical protein
MQIILYSGFLSPYQGRSKVIKESDQIENLLRKEGWMIDGSNRATINAANGKELIHVMETLRRIGYMGNLVISGWE